MKRACRIQIYVWAVFSFFNFNKQNVDFANLLGIYLSSVYSLLKLMLVGLWLGTMNCLAVHGAGKQLYWGWVLAP